MGWKERSVNQRVAKELNRSGPVVSYAPTEDLRGPGHSLPISGCLAGEYGA